MLGIKFYSDYDIAYDEEVKKIVKKINDEDINSEWGIVNLLEFHNILKYINIKKVTDHIVQETNIDIKDYEKRIRKKWAYS